MNPVLVNRWRGNAIECRHRGAVVAVDAQGRTVFALGDGLQPVFPRSAIKFLQAIPFVQSGAIERFGLDERHIALACASHNGEAIHVDTVQDWLARVGLSAAELECGAHLPLNEPTACELLGLGRAPERLHNNCSGKHAGLLSTCLAHGDAVSGYRLYQHAAQRRWFEVLEALTQVRVAELPWGYDGCAIPSLALPLQRIALAMARFASPQDLSGPLGDAVNRLHAALTSQAYLVAGKDRLDTALMQRLAPEVLVKVGAEGVYTASLPSAGIGLALKIDDGRDSAARVALGAALSVLGALTREDTRALSEWVTPAITNTRGDVVGHEEAASVWRTVEVSSAPLS